MQGDRSHWEQWHHSGQRDKTVEIIKWGISFSFWKWSIRARQRGLQVRLLVTSDTWGWTRSPMSIPAWRRLKGAWRSWCSGGSWSHRRHSSSATATSPTGSRVLLRDSKQCRGSVLWQDVDLAVKLLSCCIQLIGAPATLCNGFLLFESSHYWNIFPMCQEMVKLDNEVKQKGTKNLNLKFIILICSHHQSARPTICFIKSQTLGLNQDILFLVNTEFTCLWKKCKLALFNLKWGIRYGIYADWINFPEKKLIASGCIGAYLIWSSTTAKNFF